MRYLSAAPRMKRRGAVANGPKERGKKRPGLRTARPPLQGRGKQLANIAHGEMQNVAQARPTNGRRATEQAPRANANWDGEPVAPLKYHSEQPIRQWMVEVMAGMRPEVDALANAPWTHRPSAVGREWRKRHKKMQVQVTGQARPHRTRQAMRREVSQGEAKHAATEKVVRPVPRC